MSCGQSLYKKLMHSIHRATVERKILFSRLGLLKIDLSTNPHPSTITSIYIL